MSSVTGTLKIAFKLLSLITFLLVLQIKIHLDWPMKSSFPVECVIFVWFKQNTDDWRWELCFVIFLRPDVKCRRYIQGFILHNIFICAWNQNPPGLTIEKPISSWICNFSLIQSKKQTIEDEICVLWLFWGSMSSVVGTLKLLSFITFLFVLQIKIHLGWP